ncbi:MAG: pre-peptidase C-terminal domain-containing protein [Cyanobacteria bacterium P01_B01_bin.77]
MVQVSLFTGPDYLIENEGTVSAHAFLANDGVIPEGGLVVSVDAPNLSEFDLAGVSVEGGEIVALRDGGFDLRMTEYTTLVNLPIADDGETEIGETASFSLAVGDGYEIIADYSGGSFSLVDTRSDIPRGETTEPNNTIPFATDTQISPESPTFSGSGSVDFEIGNRYLNPDGTYTYIDVTEDADLFKVELSAGDTVTVETFEVEGNPNSFNQGTVLNMQVFDSAGNRARDYASPGEVAPPDKLFNGWDPTSENPIDNYGEFTATEDGTYYVAIGAYFNLQDFPIYQEISQPVYNPLEPGTGNGDAPYFGNYDVEINLLTENNPRKTGTPTPPVSNPNVTEPPTLSLSANPATTDSEGNFTNAVVEHVEVGGFSSVTFTIRADGEIPEEGIEFVLGSNANLFDYISIIQNSNLPSTIGGQSLGAFYNEDGIPTGIRLRIEEPTMTVTLQSANHQTWFADYYGDIIGQYEALETDGPEDVTFFLQPGDGFNVATDAGTTDVTYYDSVADVPPPTGGDIVPEVGVTISETELIETDETETTITFKLSEPPPEDGVVVYLASEQDPLVGSVLGQFNVLEAEITGGTFPVPDGNEAGFFFTITEQTAGITVSVFDELTVPGIDPFAVQEGILALDFALQPQAGYTIAPDASAFSLTIADNPDSKNQVILSGEPATLVESEGTVGVHTFTVSDTLPPEGITVSVSAPDLNEFDLAAIEVAGGSIPAVRDNGFDFTITEQTATISLPILDDDITEGSETATFTLEPGDTYEVNQQATEATFILADTVDEVSVPEEIEGNDTLAEANALGLSVESPSAFVTGLIAGDFYFDPSEDVDFYTFNLEVGQTVSLDIDAGEWNTFETFEYSVVYPALNEVQLTDTELRLFDAEGNELAANNDGVAPGEEFSRDPYLEFTAETAGTYYVSVSGLGNRTYDPFTFRSGSAWTFPEVGVFYGPYELTAILTAGDIQPPTGGGLIGTDDDETLTGTDGDDMAAGNLGDDIITGGAGDDILRGDLNSRSPQDGIPGGNDIIFGGEGNDRIGGKAGNDILSGDAGDDVIWGDDGDDILMGVTGNDILIGDNFSDGGGSDLFVFGNGDGTDTILDFEVGRDRIGLVEDELVFADLTLAQDGANTLLGIAETGETLAILNNVQASTLGENSFVIVPDMSNPEEALAII